MKTEAFSANRPGLSKGVLAAYSGITLPVAAMGMPLAVYLPRFYSEGLGLSLATVGLIFTLARLFDVVTDPLMGLLIDRYDTRWGRRKHWVALSIPLLMVSIWMVFIPDPQAVDAAYLACWLLLLYAGYTMLTISHLSWGAELAVGYDARSRLFGWREIFIIAGMTSVLALPAALELNGYSDQQTKIAGMGWFCLILLPLLLIPTLFLVPDSRSRSTTAVPWDEAVRLIVQNHLMWRLLAADLLSGLGTAISGALYIFVASNYFQLPSHASISLLFYFLASFFAMPLWMQLAYRIGKDRALKVALLYGGGMNLLLTAIAQPGSVIMLWSFTICYGIAYGAAPMLLRSMMADLTDEDELKTGKNRAGLFFALLTTTNKLGAAFGVGASFLTLEYLFNYVPGGVNSDFANGGLLWTFCLGSASGLLLAYLPLRKYAMSRARHQQIQAALSARETQQEQT